MITHTTSRRRLPAILGRFRGHFGVDTVDLVLDLLADQPNQLGDVGAVEIPRVRQGHVDRTADLGALTIASAHGPVMRDATAIPPRTVASPHCAADRSRRQRR